MAFRLLFVPSAHKRHANCTLIFRDMPYSGFEGMAWVNQQTGRNDYVRKHNPAVIYDANTSPERLAKNKNLTEFYSDLEAKKLPQWMVSDFFL